MNRFTRILPLAAMSAFLVLSSAPANAEKIVVYGATGSIGSLIVEVALERGHEVVGVSRDPSRFDIDDSSFVGVAGDILSIESVRQTVSGADAIIISVQGNAEDNMPENSTHGKAASIMVKALSEMENAPHIVQIGGASTVGVDMESLIAHLPPFAGEAGSPMYGMFVGHMVALDTYRDSDIPWTVLSPAGSIMGWSFEGLTDGTSQRGEYRTATGDLVRNAEGNSEIYVRDLALAAVEEAVQGNFVQQQYTVGY